MLPNEEKGTILYVEDNPDNRMLVRRILLSEDYSLLEATNAAEALETLKTAKPDLILMDINMPVMDGLELLEKMKQKAPYSRIPVVLVTTLGKEEQVLKGLKLGAEGYLTKPFKADALHEMIDRVLTKK